VTPIICLLSFASVELMKKYKVKKNNIFLLDSVLRNIFPFLDTIIIPQFAKEKTMIGFIIQSESILVNLNVAYVNY
jgi:hypothetical protein